MNEPKSKKEDLESLLDQLSQDLAEHKKTADVLLQILSKIKVYGRDPVGSEPIYSRQGIRTLGNYALARPDSASNGVEISREALRCIANAMLLDEPTRHLVVDLGLLPKAAKKLEANNSDDEFLLSRVLFLTTYTPSKPDFAPLIEEQHLVKSLTQCLQRHARMYDLTQASLQTATVMDTMALIETCKLIFNISHFQPSLAAHFQSTVPSIIHIVCGLPLSRPIMQPPLSVAVNCLLNLDLRPQSLPSQAKAETNTKSSDSDVEDLPRDLVQRLIEILRATTDQYRDEELEQTAAPLVTLLRKIYPTLPDDLRKTLRLALLPSTAERERPLGKSDTLAARLLQLTTSALAPTLRTSVAAMLYELSDSDPAKFAENVGYGYASGFLMSQGIPVPTPASSEHQTNVDVNPVTGQRRDMEPEDVEPAMTEEEKEREAERLFVLFERLRATGVVDVQNPVRQAMEEGRFEELPD